MVSSLLFPGAAFGALLGGKLADRLGRKGSLLVCAGLFLVGALICAIAPNVDDHDCSAASCSASASAPRRRPARSTWRRWPRRTGAAGW